MHDLPVVRHTTCPLDCPDLCDLDITLENGRVARLDGNRDHPITRGFICGKVRHFAEHVYGPERLLTPARRVGPKGEGQFESVSWEAALDEIVRQLREALDRFGGESVLPFCYGGSNGRLTHDALDARFFRRLGASRLARTVCAAPTGRVATELYGKMHGVAYEDYAEAKLIVIWAANPQSSGIHLMPFIRAARQRGARLVVVDPRSTPLARQADLHLAIRPGTDVVVALSVIRWLFQTGRADLGFLDRYATGASELRERAEPWPFPRAAEVAGVEASQLEALATMYAASQPAVIRCGWGLERSRSAGSNVAAVLALPAVAGKFGVRGGGYTMSNSGAWKWASDATIGEPPTVTRQLNMNQLGQALRTLSNPPIRVLFVYNANPLATLPNQQLVRAGLEREDLFTVVFDQVLTDTARFADIVLPATTFLEHDDFRAGYGCSDLRHVKPVIARVGQSRPNYEVFTDLCRRMGLARPTDVDAPEEWVRSLLACYPESAAMVRQLEQQGSHSAPCGPRPVQFVDVFPATADGKIHLFPESLEREAPQGLYQYLPAAGAARYPLQLLSPATEHTINSTLGQLWQTTAELAMHAADAQERQLVTGDAVRVFNELGEVHCRMRVTSETRRGVVVLPKGLWSRHTLNGQTANALAPDTLTDIAGGACFSDARVEVEALPGYRNEELS